MLQRLVTASLLLVLLPASVLAVEKPFPAHKVVGNVYYVGSDALAVFLITTPESTPVRLQSF